MGIADFVAVDLPLSCHQHHLLLHCLLPLLQLDIVVNEILLIPGLYPDSLFIDCSSPSLSTTYHSFRASLPQELL